VCSGGRVSLWPSVAGDCDCEAWLDGVDAFCARADPGAQIHHKIRNLSNIQDVSPSNGLQEILTLLPLARSITLGMQVLAGSGYLFFSAGFYSCFYHWDAQAKGRALSFDAFKID
jgi:hypothetical protein